MPAPAAHRTENTTAIPDHIRGRLRTRIPRVAAPGIAVALVRPGQVDWVSAHGVRAAATGDPVTADTAFLWFSMTKIATATAVLQLVESATIRLDEPARSYVPDLASLDSRITVRQLLNHTSGLANPMPMKWIHPAAEPGPDPHEMVVALLDRIGKPRHTPGDRCAYSNVGFLVLGEIIAAASGLPYRDYLVERVLRPLGATRTGFAFSTTVQPATGHHPRRDPALPLARGFIPRWVFGPNAGAWRTFTPFALDGSAYGGLIGPIGDAALLAAAHLGDGSVGGRRILAPESVREMQTIVTPGRRFDLGLGWFRPHRDSRRGRTFVEHLGGGAGYGTVMRLYPDQGVGIVAMANVSSNRFDVDRVATIAE